MSTSTPANAYHMCLVKMLVFSEFLLGVNNCNQANAFFHWVSCTGVKGIATDTKLLPRDILEYKGFFTIWN